jgi:hypothetical protein
MPVHRGYAPGFKAAAAPDAPTINGSESLAAFATAADPHTVSLASQTYSAGDYLLAVFGADGAGTIVGMSGSTDDTYTELAEAGGNPTNIAVYEGTVVGSLDANLSVDLGATRDGVGGLISISGAAANANQPDVAPSTNIGTSASPVCSSITTVTDNCLVFAVFHAAGGHTKATVEAAVPSGWNLLFADVTGPNETATFQSTVGIAYKVQATEGATGNAAWTSALDASMQWSAIQVAVRPA